MDRDEGCTDTPGQAARRPDEPGPRALPPHARRRGGGPQGPHRGDPRPPRHGRLGHLGRRLRPHREALPLPAAAGRAAPAGLQREARHLFGGARRLDRRLPLQHPALHRRPGARRGGRRARRRLSARPRGPHLLHRVLPGAALRHGDRRRPRPGHRSQGPRRDARHRPRDRRRGLLRQRAARRQLAAERPRLLRAALGPDAQRGLRRRRRLRGRSGARRRDHAHQAAPRRRRARRARARPRGRARHRDARLHGALGAAEPRARGDEQAERQLPRRGAAQGTRRRVRRRRHHGGRRGRRRALPAVHRPDSGLPHPRRLRPQLPGQAHRARGPQDPRRHGQAPGLPRLPPLPGDRRGGRHAQGPDARHRRRRQRPRQDRARSTPRAASPAT